MTHTLRPTLCGMTVLMVALLCGGLAPRDGAPGRPVAAVVAADLEAVRAVVLPAGFAAAVDRATSARFVRVVADDVDQDGDLDVVASVGSLDLMVWQNDGAGHFTRLPSSHRLTFQTQPPAPAVDGDSIVSNEWIQNDDRGGGLVAPLRPIVDAAPRAAPVASIDPVSPPSGPRPRSPRAPPPA
jgi:hypothetical protein